MPADACLTAGQKAGLMVGKTVIYVGAVLFLILLVLLLAEYTS